LMFAGGVMDTAAAVGNSGGRGATAKAQLPISLRGVTGCLPALQEVGSVTWTGLQCLEM
jgi:hypothetical protein